MTEVTLMNNSTKCLVTQETFDGKLIHNICTGTEKLIPWAAGDIVGMTLLSGVMIGLIVLMVGLFVMMVKS